MIITAIDNNILIGCKGEFYILVDENITKKQEKITESLIRSGAPVRNVYKEISCDNFYVAIDNNNLLIKNKHTYTISLNIMINKYTFPDTILACYRDICWTCESGVNLHTMNLETLWFEYVLNKRKTIEGRLYDEKRRKLGIGDCILFKSVNRENSARILYTVILGLRYYNSFKEMLVREGLKRVLPDIDSVDEGVRVYRKYYDVDKENKYGVVAIEIDLL